jgi:hypothetical protein
MSSVIFQNLARKREGAKGTKGVFQKRKKGSSHHIMRKKKNLSSSYLK